MIPLTGQDLIVELGEPRPLTMNEEKRHAKAARQSGAARKAGRRKIRQERRGIAPLDRAEGSRGWVISGGRCKNRGFSRFA
jgi:hypothetical protein